MDPRTGSLIVGASGVCALRGCFKGAPHPQQVCQILLDKLIDCWCLVLPEVITKQPKGAFAQLVAVASSYLILDTCYICPA